MPGRGQRADDILERQVERGSPPYGQWEPGNRKPECSQGSEIIHQSPGGGAIKEEHRMSWKKRGVQKMPVQTPRHSLIRTGPLGRLTEDKTGSDRSHFLWITFNDPGVNSP